ncbi:hypothetical protein COCON_G00063630 [Conger conger]|uniref:Uncharacterized protein n=1 Tax=Conger conger TaxID=82655 RepID=A0A9Q1DRZ1_CONCO|nr:hypothetical protein COCON_G00063630 [Conger conger]
MEVARYPPFLWFGCSAAVCQTVTTVAAVSEGNGFVCVCMCYATGMMHAPTLLVPLIV